MAYLRLSSSNWYVFQDINKQLNIWYPYSSNALQLSYKECLNITEEKIRKHFKIPIPSSDMKELLYAIQTFLHDVNPSKNSKPMNQKLEKELERRYDMDIWQGRWIRKFYVSSFPEMNDGYVNNKKWMILYHDDGFDDGPYTKNVLFITDCDTIILMGDSLNMNNVIEWKLSYKDAIEMISDNSKFDDTFNPEAYNEGDRAILLESLQKFVKDVEEGYPNEKNR